MKILFKHNKGQTFIIIFLLMLISLTIGIAISSRFIATLRSVINTDNATKARNAADAGIERMLALPMATLEGYIDFNNCGANCYSEVTDITGKLITNQIKLSYIGNSADPYIFEASRSQVSQVLLNGYTSGQDIYLCWDNDDASLYASYIYLDGSNYGATAYAANSLTYSGVNNGFAVSSSILGYTNCIVVTADHSPRLIRVKSFYEDTTVYAIPAVGQNMPRQGVFIESTGKFLDSAQKSRVIRTQPMVSGYFDYALYQKSETDTLSN